MRYTASYRRAHTAFRRVRSKHRLTVIRDLTAFPPGREEIEDCVASCAANGVACVIPRLPRGLSPSAELLDGVRDMYAAFTTAAAHHGIKVGFLLDRLVEESFFLRLDRDTALSMCSRSLMRREYYCDPHEVLHMRLHGGELMALVAYDDEHTDMIDLRSHVRDGWLDYEVPEGNWTIEEYICTPEPERGEPPLLSCNRLSATACMNFLNGLSDAFSPALETEPGSVISTLFVTDLCFQAPNRRNWIADFNHVFETRFGFDPAPFYPALYHNIGERDRHIKSLFMDCRAEMLRSGYLCALKAFADRHNVRLIVAGTEPKLPACSWLAGDALANQVFAPCAVQEKSYLYGVNSLHLAASAADNYGSKFVACELFRDYARQNEEILRKDTLNAFGLGANLLMAHTDADHPLFRKNLLDRIRTWLTGRHGRFTYPEFVARIQALLRGGGRVNDIAILYPIYALHDRVYLYEAPTGGQFEYPKTPYSCNYMTVLNSITTYAGQDVTILHPQSLSRNCSVEGNVLRLTTFYQTQQFRILILPAADMVSLDNMRRIRDFYDAGGKMLAVGKLPVFAFEFNAASLEQSRSPDDFMMEEDYGTDNDRELRAIVRHIFGEKAADRSIIRDIFHNANPAGGEAYFVGSNLTGADGSEMTDCATLTKILRSLHVPLDVYLPRMPRFDGTGAFNTAYQDFTRLGLVDYIPGGGMVSHIHKRRDNRDRLDIFFLSNTTDRTYDEPVYLRGVLSPSLWDPQTGKTLALHPHYVRNCGEVYTRIHLTLPHDRGVFLVSGPPRRADVRRAASDSLPDVTDELE